MLILMNSNKFLFQVTIVLPERRDALTQQYLPSENSTSQQPTSVVQPQIQTEILHKFHESVGLNVQLNSERTVATRCREYNNTVLLSEAPLENNEIFEIAIQEIAREWSGCLKIGVLSNETGNWLTSMNLVPGMTSIPNDAWYLTSNELKHTGYVLALNYCPSLDWLRVGDKIGMKRTHDGNLKFYINGEDMGIAASDVPENIYAVIELFGSTVAVSITSSKQQNTAISPNASLRLQDSLELLSDPMPPVLRNDAGIDTSIDISEGKLINEMTLTPTQPNIGLIVEGEWSYEFHENHGRNIQLETKTIARRVASYNQGVVMSSRPLIKGKPFQIKIDKLNERWVSNILCGVSCISPEKASFPVTALGFKRHSWIICSDWISHNGTRVKTKYGVGLENLQCNCIIGLLIDEDSKLHLLINGMDQGIAATDLPPYVFAVIDLYGQCEQISITGEYAYTNVDNVLIAPIECANIEVEDVENTREKADLDCHEKENAVPTTSSDFSSSASISVPSQCNLNNKDDHFAEYSSFTHNDNNTNLANNNVENKTMLGIDSNNSDSSSDLGNDSFTFISDRSVRNKVYMNNSDPLNNSSAVSNNQPENNSSDLGTENCAIASVLNIRSECTNVEINNATNINIKNGMVASASNMTNLNAAITSTNANNAINESIASNSQVNNISTMQQNNMPMNNLSTSHSDSLSCQNVTPNTQNNITSDFTNNVCSGFHEVRSTVNRNNVTSIRNDGNISLNHNMANHTYNTSQIPLMPSLPSTPLASTITSLKKCEYLKACMQLKKSLVLPDEFFSADEILCYCSACYKIDGDNAICKKGEPPAEFAIPVGWARFPLKQNINANQIPSSTTDKWHVAFYGIRLEAIR